MTEVYALAEQFQSTNQEQAPSTKQDVIMAMCQTRDAIEQALEYFKGGTSEFEERCKQETQMLALEAGELITKAAESEYNTAVALMFELTAKTFNMERRLREIGEEYRSEEAEELEVETLPLATYKLEKNISNHALINKAITGLADIAKGEASFTLTPKTGSKSKESYELTASKGKCASFFYDHAGNAQIVGTVLATIYALRTDHRAKGFVYRGRIWFTVNTIVEEMRRTTGGTIRAKEYKNDRALVDAAIEAASSAQISGKNPKGETLNLIYLVNAVRRDRIEYNGNTYRDVWGFEAEMPTMNDYARENNYIAEYPLLEMPKAKSMNEAWIENYLKDILHQARGELYTKGDNPKKTKTPKVTHKRSWPSIFELAKPLGEMDSRQKNSLVKDFNKMLGVLAEMDSHSKLSASRPLYIRAYSERDGSKGRGKGAWLNLVIECTSEFHTPEINLL